MLQKLTRFLFGTLRGRLIVGVAAVHAVMMALFIVDLTMRQRAMLLDRQTEQAVALSQALATSAAVWIAADDIAGMQELVEVQRRYPELIFALLTDERGRVLAHTDRTKQGLFVQDIPEAVRQTLSARTAALVDVTTPATVAGRHVGWARVGVGQKLADAKLTRITMDGVIYALAAIIAGSVIAWLMGNRISRRLYAVQETISQIQAGNHHARSRLTGSDEAAVMAQEFNAMLDALAERDAELRASEEKFRSLIQNVPAAIVLHDGQGRILDSNPLARELLGLSADQLLGKELIDPAWHFQRDDGSILPVDDYPVSQVLATGTPLRGQVVGISRPDRESIAWVLVNAEPLYDAAHNIGLIIVSFIDISDRKQAEETLRRLNRELRAISNCNLVLMRATDEQALLTDVCRIVCDEAGYRMAWVGYVERDDAHTIRPVAWAGAEHGYLAEARLTWADTERGRGPSGNAIRTGRSDYIQDFATDPKAMPWREIAAQRGYRSSIALPLKEENGAVFGILCIYSTKPDIFSPEEIRLLEELAGDLAFGIRAVRTRIARKVAEQSSSLLGFALDNVQEAAFLIDETARFHYVNNEACRFLGYTHSELLTMGVTDIDPDFPPERWAAHWQELATQRALTFEERLQTKDGRLVPVEISANYIETDENCFNLALVRDMTERKRTEENMLQLNAELDRRVRARTTELEEKNTELERMNRLFVGREMRMMELKARIKELEATTGGIK
jgi:PAS domain S-box-containing protein